MPKSKPKTKTVTKYRDARTGQYITENEAKKHPNTTVKETDKVGGKKKPPKKNK
jgi:hypothetical protein